MNQVKTRSVTIENGLASLEDGTTVNLLAIQSALNEAFSETGDHDYMEACVELAKLTGMEATALGHRPSAMPDTDAMVPPWTQEQSRIATLEGWDIFHCSGSSYGLWQIQHLDEAHEHEPQAKQLDDDEHAWREVFAGKLAHHKAAKEFIRCHNHAEYLTFLKDVHPLRHLNETLQLRKPAGYEVGGFTVGHVAKMNGNQSVARIVDLNDAQAGLLVTLEYECEQPVDAPEGATSRFFEVPARKISSTWA